jgi:hypothetical protein
VELLLTPPKVARRAVRILVVTVRSATARRQATPPPWVAQDRAASRADWGGKIFRTYRRESGSRSVTQLAGVGGVRTGANRGAIVAYDSVRRGVSPWGRIKDGGGVGASFTIAVSRGGSATPKGAGPDKPPSRDGQRADMVPNRREEETSVVSHQTGRVESSR